jgi:hypothetical protein
VNREPPRENDGDKKRWTKSDECTHGYDVETLPESLTERVLWPV